jgi:vacuolar iron transporter family protein
MLRGRLRPGAPRVRPHEGELTSTESAAASKSGALRAAVFGVNDGLVSNLSLIMGVTGAGVSNKVVLLAGVAGLLAGAFSMGAGEYISMRTQREVFERLIHLEAHELAMEPEEEREELADIYRRKGVPDDLARQLVEAVHRDPDLALETHAREELGLDPDEGLGSPWAAAGSSFVTFAVGAVIPLIPFMIGSGVAAAIASAVVSGVALFSVGAIVSRLTGKRFYVSGLRMLLVGGVAASITYGVGKLLDVGVGL